MTVTRTEVDHGTSYELRDDAGPRCTLGYSTDPDGPAVWKILLPGPGGTEDLYGAEQFADPDAAQLKDWLSPFIGDDQATELVDAVDADPPPTAGWQSRSA
jgi:hypothetical protein